MVQAAALGAALLCAVPLISAHTWVYGAWVKGEFQGDGRGVYVRTPPNNSPIKDLASPDMNCGLNGGKAVPQFIKVAPGDQVEFEWFHNDRQDDIVDRSHVGGMTTMVSVYTDGAPTGPIWTKIAEEGFDAATQTWASDRMIANKGRVGFTVPPLVAGKYIFQQNLAALHEADAAYSDNPGRGVQFYPNCVQVDVTGSGTAVPDRNFDMTSMTAKSPGVVWNLYWGTKPTDYTMYGPPMSKLAAGGTGTDTGAATGNTPATSTTGAGGTGCATGITTGITGRVTIGGWTFTVAREPTGHVPSVREKRVDAAPAGARIRLGSGRRGVLGRAFKA